nr:redox-regulated ATPase YchF [Alphaproteobacteria bacterium]
GKSTLYNALSQQAHAESANYPFCTIEPNIGRVPVADARLDKIAALANSAETIPAVLEIIDIAGLVRGASKGEGLGNQFLAHIREVDAIIHLLRCFDDSNITHVEGSADPLRDAEIIATELMLADLASLEKQRERLVKIARSGDKDAIAQLGFIEKIIPLLEAGTMLKNHDFDADELIMLKSLHMLSHKPILYIANVDEDSVVSGNHHSKAVFEHAKQEGSQALLVSAAIEAELIALPIDEQQDFLETLGLKETSLKRIIQGAAELLNLITYFTAGPKEARAWHITKGTSAPDAAGVIHSDFARGFISAEIISYEDYLQGGEKHAKENGKLRIEGRDYIMQDADITHFRFNV